MHSDFFLPVHGVIISDYISIAFASKSKSKSKNYSVSILNKETWLKTYMTNMQLSLQN